MLFFVTFSHYVHKQEAKYAFERALSTTSALTKNADKRAPDTNTITHARRRERSATCIVAFEGAWEITLNVPAHAHTGDVSDLPKGTASTADRSEM